MPEYISPNRDIAILTRCSSSNSKNSSSISKNISDGIIKGNSRGSSSSSSSSRGSSSGSSIGVAASLCAPFSIGSVKAFCSRIANHSFACSSRSPRLPHPASSFEGCDTVNYYFTGSLYTCLFGDRQKALTKWSPDCAPAIHKESFLRRFFPNSRPCRNEEEHCIVVYILFIWNAALSKLFPIQAGHARVS